MLLGLKVHSQKVPKGPRMNEAHTKQDSVIPMPSSSVSLLGAVIVLAIGVRVAAAISRTQTSWARCLRHGDCDALIGATLASPGPAIASLLVVTASSVPLILWLRSARNNTERVAEVFGLLSKAAGYFAAGILVLMGTLLVLQPTRSWSISVGVAAWIVGFAIVSRVFRGSRWAQILYVMAVISLPLLISWLDSAAVV